MKSFDIDGVIYINKDVIGLRPEKGDIIITGRSYEEYIETSKMLWDRDIWNMVFYNPIPFDNKTRESSGEHKARTLNLLKSRGYDIEFHIDDDEVQVEVIKRECPWLNVLHLVHNLTEKENVRHYV